jgi:3-(3-hydroxy-phenyl)propionate hydroxylase
VVHLRHRGQDGHPDRSWEDMTDTLVPKTAPVGWVAIVRPDRTVLHDGPAARLDGVVREALALLRRDAAAGRSSAHAEPAPKLAA